MLSIDLRFMCCVGMLSNTHRDSVLMNRIDRWIKFSFCGSRRYSRLQGKKRNEFNLINKSFMLGILHL